LSSSPRPLRQARQPNCRKFWTKKSVDGFVSPKAKAKVKENFFKQLLTNEKNYRYIICARKNTEEDDSQVLSIKTQLVELKEICRQSSKFFKLIFLEKFTTMSYD